MKEIHFRIPTSFSEAKLLYKEHCDNRYKHNLNVLREFAKKISDVAHNDYWKGDISDTMKKNVFDRSNPNSCISTAYWESLKNMK